MRSVMKTTEQSHKWVLTDVSGLTDFSADFRNYCEEKQLDEGKIFELELSLEELIVNSFTHGYKNVGAGTVTIEVEDIGSDIKISLQDKAPPFDLVRQAPAPRLGGEDGEPESGGEDEAVSDPGAELEEKEEKVGGLGIHLVKSLNDRVEYYGSKDGNIVVIIKSKL